MTAWQTAGGQGKLHFPYAALRQLPLCELAGSEHNAILDCRKEMNMTLKQLSEATGIAQGDISKIENGCANPSLKTIERIAKGMGKKLRLEFV